MVMEIPVGEDRRGPGWYVAFGDPWFPNSGIHFAFQSITPGEANLCVVRDGPVLNHQLEDRINPFSLQSKEAFAARLRARFGDDVGWMDMLERAWRLVLERLATEDPAIRLVDAPDDGLNDYLLPPFIPADRPAVIFGKGGSGKSYLALAAAVAVATGTDFIGQPVVTPGAVLYIDYESTATRQKRRLSAVLRGRGLAGDDLPIYYWPGHGVPLRQQIEAIRQRVIADDIRLVVVDSVALACGGDPKEPGPALEFFGALDSLAVPSLCIAHITKAGEEEYPYGSVFWHNAPGATWLVRSRQERETHATHITLIHRKTNDDHLQEPVGVRMAFEPGGLVVRFETEETGERGQTQTEQVLGALAEGQMSTKEVAGLLGVKLSGARNVLSRLGGSVGKVGKAKDGSDLWGRTDGRAEGSQLEF